jgi:hypothetical protein
MKEENVRIQTGGTNVLNYTLAWVCSECSAAFPIAVGKAGLIKKPGPLYGDGGKLD